ncbi:MAG TPA: hypothetical protein PLD89_11630, partial [Promineifilum sp.]|nr:hypothetical protein [Promineifilum sp.]HRO90849.1 hypothetical protein [Promineifilum sp.]
LERRSGVVLQGEKEGGTKSFHDATCKEGSPSIHIVEINPYNQHYENDPFETSFQIWVRH